MPIGKNYNRAPQSFLFARVTRAKHDFKPPGRWCPAVSGRPDSKTHWEGYDEPSYYDFSELDDTAVWELSLSVPL
jgi:hypothetical protein